MISQHSCSQRPLSVVPRKASKVLGCAALATTLAFSHVSLAGQIWDGGGADGFWATPANWNGDTLPTAAALTFDGTSQLNANNNLFPAATTIGGFTFNATAGSFVLSGNSIGLGGNVVNSSTVNQTFDMGVLLTGNRTISGTGDVTFGSGGSFNFGTANRTTTISNTKTILAGNVYLSSDATARVQTLAGAGAIDITGKVSNGTGGATGGQINKTGTGTLTLTNGTSDHSGVVAPANTFTRATSHISAANSGTTVIAADSTGSGGSVTSGPLGTGYAAFRGGLTLQAGGVGARTIGNNILFQGVNTITGNDLTFTGVIGTNGGAATLTINNSQTTISGGVIIRQGTDTAARALTINGTGNTLINSVISSGPSISGEMTYAGSGIHTVSGANTYNGATIIGVSASATTVKLGNPTALGFGGPVFQATGGTSVVAGATLDLNGQVGVNELLSINGTGVGGNGALINSNTTTTAVIDNGVAAVTIAGSVAGYTSPTISFSGGTGSGAAATVNQATNSITLTSAGNYSAAPTATINGGTGATAAVSLSTVTLASAASVGGAGNITINAAVGGAGAATLTKVGAGTLKMTSVAANNNYAGVTAVSAGTFLVNGTHLAAGNYTVASGAALGGTGSITLAGANTVSVTGTLAPGDSTLAANAQTGTLSIGNAVVGATSALSLNSGSSVVLQLGGTAVGDGAGTYDQINMVSPAGSITLTGTVTLSLSLVNGFTPLTTDVFFVINRADAGAYSVFFDGAGEGAAVSLGGGYSGTITYLADSVGSTITGGNDIAIYNVVAVPEPQEYAVGMMALLGMVIFFRNRRRQLEA